MDSRISTLRLAALWAFELLAIPVSAICVPIAVLFAKWDSQPTTFTGGAPDNGPPTVRGELPKWAWWLDSFDERLPGGMYEPTVQKVYKAVGRYWCSVYWLVVRNRLIGLQRALFPSKSSDAWTDERRVGPLVFEWGTKRYRASYDAHWIRGPFSLVDYVSFRLA